MAKLTKRDVESLLDAYDRDPQGALHRALARALDRPHDGWPALVAAAGLPAALADGLLAGDTGAQDALARLLNEVRTVPGVAAPPAHHDSGRELLTDPRAMRRVRPDV